MNAPAPHAFFLTTNEEKFEEIAGLLEEEAEVQIERRTARLPVPPSGGPGAVARFRAQEAFKVLGAPVFAEALSIELADGVVSGASFRQAFEDPEGSAWRKRHDGAHGVARIAVGYAAGEGEARVYEAAIPGRLTATPRGEGNAPWESFWIPDGQTRTLGELADEPIADDLQNAPYMSLARALRAGG